MAVGEDGLKAPVEQSPFDWSSFLGTQIVVETVIGKELHGEFFCYDCDSRSFVLAERLQNGATRYVWVQSSAVRNVRAAKAGSSASPGGSVSSSSPSGQRCEALPAIDLKLTAERARRAETATARRLPASSGAGNPRPRQEVFDALSRRVQCTWDEEGILVQGVRIRPPYNPSTCEGGDERELAHVRQVLSEELARLQASGGDAAEASAEGQSSPGYGANGIAAAQAPPQADGSSSRGSLSPRGGFGELSADSYA
eukprot:TRINITY_DN29437_c0_g1_i1.p1 TRINITY_DN29437_c0_g1~~TRINITY_DN29437_c0_g1_i1.p1  ORF type:complete len:255 (+),score=41.09 TRINITY_DN29437_c0_g1_i1:136-900(+)